MLRLAFIFVYISLIQPTTPQVDQTDYTNQPIYSPEIKDSTTDFTIADLTSIVGLYDVLFATTEFSDTETNNIISETTPELHNADPYSDLLQEARDLELITSPETTTIRSKIMLLSTNAITEDAIPATETEIAQITPAVVLLSKQELTSEKPQNVLNISSNFLIISEKKTTTLPSSKRPLSTKLFVLPKRLPTTTSTFSLPRRPLPINTFSLPKRLPTTISTISLPKRPLSTKLFSFSKRLPMITSPISYQEPTIQVEEPTIHIEPFSTFLKKLLIYLCVKRSSDLRNLVEPFTNYVQNLTKARKLEVLGPVTENFIRRTILSTNGSTVYSLRNKLGEIQVMLMNRQKDSNDLLAYIDDMYEVKEEEEMQTVLNDIILYPNGDKNGCNIARCFVNKVFLMPMNRIAGTKRGKHLFSLITKAVTNKYSHNISKLTLQQKKITKTTTEVDIMTGKIKDNMESIENFLREGQIGIEYEESDLSEKNQGYKATASVQDTNEEAGENEKENSNVKSADEDIYEPKYPQRKVQPIRDSIDNHHAKAIKGKQKEMDHKSFAGIDPDPYFEKLLELPIHAIRVGVKNFNPDTQNKDRRKVNRKPVQKRYEIKTYNKGDEHFDGKEDVPKDLEKSSSEKHDIRDPDKKYIGKIIHKTTVGSADVEEKITERHNAEKVFLVVTGRDPKMFVRSEGVSPQNAGLKSKKPKLVPLKNDYFVDNLRFRNNRTNLATKHKVKERKGGGGEEEEGEGGGGGLEYRRRFKPRINRKKYRKNEDRYRNYHTVTDNIATVTKVTKRNHKEMPLNESLHKFFKNVDIIAYIATRTPKHYSTPMMHVEEDEEAILKRNVYKAMKKLLKK